MEDPNEWDSAAGDPQKPISWQAVKDLREAWAASTGLSDEKHDAHKFVQEIVANSASDFLSESDWLNKWVIVLDHIISFYYLAYSCYTNELEKTSSPIVRCFASLQSSIFDDLYSIRLLIAHGRELAARKLLRSLAEYFELQMLLYLDPSLISEYFSSQDEKSANKFWHKVVSKGKSAKKIERAFLEDAAGSVYSLLLEYSRDELGMLGQLVHPSYISVLLTFLRPINSRDSKDYIPFGYANDSSVRTIKHIVSLTLLSLLVMREFPLSHRSTTDELHFNPNDSLHLSTSFGRVLLMTHLGRVLVETDEFFSVSLEESPTRTG